MKQPTQLLLEEQLQALIDQGVAAAMAEAEASRVRNGYNSNGSGPRPAQAIRECSYSEFLNSNLGLKFATCTLQDDALTWERQEDRLQLKVYVVENAWGVLKPDIVVAEGEDKSEEVTMRDVQQIVRGTFLEVFLMGTCQFPHPGGSGRFVKKKEDHYGCALSIGNLNKLTVKEHSQSAVPSGLVGYYQVHEGFFEDAKPMNKLTQKKVMFGGVLINKKQLFNVEAELCSAPILAST
ncbi:hypothetical protein Tco_0486799 [Tanacetum coccineum]